MKLVAFSGHTHMEEGHCEQNSINIQMNQTFAQLLPLQFQHTFSLMDVMMIIIMIMVMVMVDGHHRGDDGHHHDMMIIDSVP